MGGVFLPFNAGVTRPDSEERHRVHNDDEE